jgi:hypothetical protein
VAFLVVHQGIYFYAPMADDVLAGVFGEHYARDASAEERAEQREEIAFRAATQAQGIVALAAVDAGVFDPDDEDEGVLTAIFGSRELPAPDLAWEWNRSELPLILTSTAVELRGRPFPAGPYVTVINSSSAIRLIYGLAGLGTIELVRL